MTHVEGNVGTLLQMYSQNSLRPAQLKQSIPRTIAVAPAKDVEPIKLYGRVCFTMYRAGAPTVKQEMKTIFPVVVGIVPPGLRHKTHWSRFGVSVPFFKQKTGKKDEFGELKDSLTAKSGAPPEYQDSFGE